MKLLRTIYDWVWENVHSPQIQFLNLGDSYNDFGMMDRFEFLKDCTTSIPLLSLELSNFYTIHCGFYGSLNEQNWICELCTFSQIGPHIKPPST